MSKKDNGILSSRRHFLQTSLSLIPLTVIGTSPATSAASLINDAHSQPGISPQYVPIFFNNDEWAFILSATDRLIPGDENGPGAVSEGVPIYIDKQMELLY